jgi:hypothetical protein
LEPFAFCANQQRNKRTHAMHFDPKKSREAHSQIGNASHVAASSLPPAPDILSGPRDSHPAAGRGAAPGQPFGPIAHPHLRLVHPAPEPIEILRRQPIQRPPSVREALKGGERGAQAAGVLFGMFLIIALAVLA